MFVPQFDLLYLFCVLEVALVFTMAVLRVSGSDAYIVVLLESRKAFDTVSGTTKGMV